MERQRLVTWDDPKISAMQARQMGGLDFMNKLIAGEIPPPPIARLLDMELIHVDTGTATFKLNLNETHYNPIGTVHGGIASTLLDSAMGCAVQTNLPPGMAYTTTQLNINLVRALHASIETVWCKAEVIHAGRSTATAEAKIYDKNDKLYAHGTTTCLIFPINGQ